MPRLWNWRRFTKGETTEQAQARLERERRELAIDYRQTFATPHGQRVLADLLRKTGVLQTTYDAHPPNAAYNQGRQQVGLEIIEMCNADPGARDQLALTGETETLFP